MTRPRSIQSLARPSFAGLITLLAMGASLVLVLPSRADDLGWPRQFDSPSGTFVIYQPQPEQLDGDLLTGRAAFSLQKSKDAYPRFGVLWYAEQIEIDRDSSTVDARSIDITKVRLPGITADEAGRYESLIEGQTTGWDLSGSVEELRAGLAAAEQERASVAGIDNAPPRILFHNRRAILVVYDGTPAVEPIEGSRLQRVVNTPYAVVFDPRKRSYYLNGANLWYEAKDPLGPWANISDPPAAVRDIVPPDTTTYDQVEGSPPEVLTATEPTELIATNGSPRYAPLVDDELLYVTNTESDVVLEVGTQSFYVLLSGRWFRASSMDGPWAFVRGDQLPASFNRIPLDSPKGNILASVAGTDEAEDALADAQIPQTSAIKRSNNSFYVTYDGQPEFDPIEGTDLEYAVNTDAEVILGDGRYYACEQGVWYIADDPDGPWSVSDTRPVGLEDIPPSCPVYDVRYVYIYDSTPDVVYVGYLPGYLGCYPYHGTVVYGTGYRYGSWRSRHHYYPRRFTWGFGARYNPWLNRWSFGFSYSTGFLRVGTRWRSVVASAPTQTRSRPMWFGPGGYRRPLIASDMTLLRTRTVRERARVSDGLPANVYNRTENVTRVDRRSIERIRVRPIVKPITRPATAHDDVFAGKDGKVYRRDPKGWQVRTGTKWTPTNLPVAQPSVNPPAVNPPAVSPPPTLPSEEGRERVTPPPAARSRPDVRRRRDPAVERRMPDRDNPPEERATPRRERPTPPSPPAERPAPPSERPAPPPVSQEETPAARERPAPPPEKPEPGNLEREYRARQRADREDNADEDSPKARSRSHGQESQNSKEDENEKERPQRSRERSGRNR
jgi:hypothetical protein